MPTMGPDMSAMVMSYNYYLVALSVAISTLASYAAFDLAGRVTTARGAVRMAWLSGGACAMGMGIAAMHYIGMSAMRLAATCRYSVSLATLSVVLAVVISLVALRLAFSLRQDRQRDSSKKIASALVMGAAIPVMHYTGMAAATFVPSHTLPNLARSVNISIVGTTGITIVVLFVLGMALFTSVVDRRFAEQTLKLESTEQRYPQLVESAQVVLWRRHPRSLTFDFVNSEAETLFGYPVTDWLTQPAFWIEHIHQDDREKAEFCCPQAVLDGRPQQFEHRMIAANGATLWMRTCVRVIAEGPPLCNQRRPGAPVLARPAVTQTDLSWSRS